MPREKQPARIYTRPGRKGYWAYFSRQEPNVKLHGDTEAEAAAHFAVLVAETEANSLRSGEVGKGDTLATYAQGEIEYSKIASSKNMARDVRRDLLKIVKWLERRGVSYANQVTRSVIEAYITSRRSVKPEPTPENPKATTPGVSAARVNRELNSFRRLMERAAREVYLPPDVLACFASGRRGGLYQKEPQPKVHQILLTLAQVHAFLAECNQSYQPLFRVAVGSGLRDDEVRHLSIADITDASITVSAKPPGYCECCPAGWTPKNFKHRTVPASKETVEAARAWVAVRAKLTQSPANVWRSMQRTQKRVGLPQFSMHDLRRVYASNLLSVGVGLTQISRLLGHRDVITTTRYLGVVDATVSVSQLLL